MSLHCKHFKSSFVFSDEFAITIEKLRVLNSIKYLSIRHLIVRVRCPIISIVVVRVNLLDSAAHYVIIRVHIIIHRGFHNWVFFTLSRSVDGIEGEPDEAIIVK